MDKIIILLKRIIIIMLKVPRRFRLQDSLLELMHLLMTERIWVNNLDLFESSEQHVE